MTPTDASVARALAYVASRTLAGGSPRKCCAMNRHRRIVCVAVRTCNTILRSHAKVSRTRLRDARARAASGPSPGGTTTGDKFAVEPTRHAARALAQELRSARSPIGAAAAGEGSRRSRHPPASDSSQRAETARAQTQALETASEVGPHDCEAIPTARHERDHIIGRPLGGDGHARAQDPIAPVRFKGSCWHDLPCIIGPAGIVGGAPTRTSCGSSEGARSNRWKAIASAQSKASRSRGHLKRSRSSRWPYLRRKQRL